MKKASLHELLVSEKNYADYADLFKGIGVLPGASKLHLKDNATPVVNPSKRIPEALQKRLKPKLDQMVKDKIITQVKEPTD